jgi:hypothetical protein
MNGTSRAQFLARGGKGGLALVATAELLAIDFYTRAIAWAPPRCSSRTS